LFTGQYPHNHGVLDNTKAGTPGGWSAFRPHERQALAVALRGAGYRTALVGKYLNQYVANTGKPPGWDTWHVETGHTYWTQSDPPRYTIDERAKKAAAIAEGTKANTPLFLWYAEIAPHSQGGTRPGVARRHRGAFKNVASRRERARLQSILAVDDGVARIAAALGSDRWDRACVVVLSDNGFLLGEHNRTGKGLPYDGAVRVPLLARCPGIAPGSDQRLVANIDLAPTLAHAAGVELGWSVDGRALQDGWQRERVLLGFWGSDEDKGRQPFAGVRTRDETYVEYEDGTTVLWDRRDDDEETDQLAGADAAQWASWLETLRDCAGETCRQAEDGG
jgi:arylsulfatase A-like enzyme